MPDPRLLRSDLRAFLARGPARAADVASHLKLSQPVFSRLVDSLRDELLVLGRARATRYLARREIFDLGPTLPVYEIQEDGSARHLAQLHAVLPHAFHFEGLAEDADSGHFDDLPYFLHDLRPAGFLGRLVPRRHPELKLPADVTLWTADQTLSFVARHGWNLPGNFIVGDEAFRRHLEHATEPPDQVDGGARARRYPELAENVMTWGNPGSSAGGEQPKFLLVRAPGDKAVMVKFSPPVRDATSRRLADLLIAEHLALECLRAAGHAAARTELVEAGERVFLESERFDRLPGGGRRGLLSMLALDAEFVGHGASWSDSAAALHAQGRIDAPTLAEVRWRELFGLLIGNSDMHGGNLSFFTRGTRVLGLAPSYDMAPALYAPSQGHLREPAFRPPTPGPADAPFWDSACAAALALWTRLADHPLVSAEFRALAEGNGEAVARARPLGRLLPGT
jgi:hypothetical protein